MSTEARRTKLVEEALSYVGTPFRHLGRKPGIGLDCAGLIICAANNVGYNIDAPTVYSRRPRPKELLNNLLQFCVEVDNDGTAGLIHFMRPRAGCRGGHFSIRLDENRIIEAVMGSAVGVNNYDPKLILSTWVLKEPD